MFRQQKWFETREFDANSEGIEVKYKNVGEYNEYHVGYEEITGPVRRRRASNKKLLYAGGLCLLLSLAGATGGSLGYDTNIEAVTFFCMLGMVCLAIYALTSKSYRYLICADNEAIAFLENTPSDEKLTGFIDDIMERRKQFMRKKYMSMDPEEPVEEHIKKLRWLLREHVIDEEEFRQNKRMLMERKKPGVGFLN